MRKIGYIEENTIISGSDHMLNEEQSKEGSGSYWKLSDVCFGETFMQKNRGADAEKERSCRDLEVELSRENRTCKVPEVVTSMESVIKDS